MLTGLVPGPVQNLKRYIDPKQASVTLNWDPPLNFKRAGEVTAYDIRFNPKETSNCTQFTVDVSTTRSFLTRDSGIKASTMHSFEVRARNAESIGEWNKVTAFVGEFTVDGTYIFHLIKA